MNVALMCIAKDEDNYIDEWIEYHRKLGISKIIIYQNQWRYHGKYLHSDFVELVEFDMTHPQPWCYDDFIDKYYNQFDWAGFIDVDEYVVLKHYNNISDFLENYNEFDSLGLHWNMFGSGGQEFHGDYSLVRRFTRCRWILDSHVKSFIHLSKVKNTLKFVFWSHNVDAPNHTITVDKARFINGDRDDGDTSTHRDIAYINHYYIKTPHEWMWKMKRGEPTDCQDWFPPNHEQVLYNIFNSPQYNEYEDWTAYNFMFNS